MSYSKYTSTIILFKKYSLILYIRHCNSIKTIKNFLNSLHRLILWVFVLIFIWESLNFINHNSFKRVSNGFNLVLIIYLYGQIKRLRLNYFSLSKFIILLMVFLSFNSITILVNIILYKWISIVYIITKFLFKNLFKHIFSLVLFRRRLS